MEVSVLILRLMVRVALMMMLMMRSKVCQKGSVFVSASVCGFSIPVKYGEKKNIITCNL